MSILIPNNSTESLDSIESLGGWGMKITQKIIDDLTVALAHTKKDGTENWKDGDEIDVCIGGTFANDKFISLINRSKDKWR